MKKRRMMALMMASVLTLTNVGNVPVVFASDLGADLEDVLLIEEEVADIQEEASENNSEEIDELSNDVQPLEESDAEYSSEPPSDVSASDNSLTTEASVADSSNDEIIIEDVQVFEGDLSALAADGGGQEDAAEAETGYSVWFEGLRSEDDDDYTSASTWVFVDEDMTLNLNTQSLAGVSYTVDWTVGIYDYDTESYTSTLDAGTDYTVSEDGNSISFNGGDLAEFSDFFRIHAAILIDGEEVSSADARLSIWESSEVYFFPLAGGPLPAGGVQGAI